MMVFKLLVVCVMAGRIVQGYWLFPTRSVGGTREGVLGEGKLGRREGNTKWSQPVIQIGNGIPQDIQKDKDSQLTTF